MWLGTFETAEEAAKAYDEAACLLRGSNTRTNRKGTKQQEQVDDESAARVYLVQIKSHIRSRATESIRVFPSKVTSTTITSTNSSNTENNDNSFSSGTAQNTQLFDDDDAYRPDLSNFREELEPVFDSLPNGHVLDLQKPDGLVDTPDLELSEFERMKVE